MYKENQGHKQLAWISNVNDLPEKQRKRLEKSWAGVFYREFFCWINESAFAVLYADIPSRPNVPVNVLVGLEALKAGFGWSDEELHDVVLVLHYLVSRLIHVAPPVRLLLHPPARR